MTKLLQLAVAGVSVGSMYALVALGFVIIFKSTGVINFAQGSFVMLGAYFAFTFKQRVGIPFYLSVVMAMAACALVGLVLEVLVLRRMVGQPVFAIVMVTLGFVIVAEKLIEWLWRGDIHSLGDPWGYSTFNWGGVVILHAQVVRIIVAGVVLVGFFLFFRYSRVGVAMRATASDQEAALANGISARRIFSLSWAIAAALGALAGVLLAAGTRGLDPTLWIIALLAFPALILGGIDSPGGAVLGGLVIGLVEEMTKGYGPTYLPAWTGANFHRVMPYILLVAILIIRPHGLFGTKEVERI